MTDAVQYQILEAVQAGIQGLTLTDLASDRVKLEAVPSDKATDCPFISVYIPRPEEIPPSEGDNARDSILFYVGVAMIAAKEDVTEWFPKTLLWREQIRRLFHLQRLTGITGAAVMPTVVIPGTAVDRDAWERKDLLAGLLILKIEVIEVRP